MRVKESVSCEEEMSAIGYLVAKQKPSPAILFDNIKGYEKSPTKRVAVEYSRARAFRASR